MSFSGFSSSGSGNTASNKTDFPHDIKTQSGLTNLFNKPVVHAETVTRPLNGFPFQAGPISHSAVKVTTKDGGSYLVHKGPDYGKSNQTVVLDAEHMGDKWKSGPSQTVQGATVGDYVKAGGLTYSSIGDNNCHGARKRMMDLK